MNEFVKLIDENLEYVHHEFIEDIIYIYVISNREEVVCPFCGKPSTIVHSHYRRSFQDLPLISTVKDMFKNKCSIRAIAKTLGISRATVKSYLDENVSAISAAYEAKRKSILDPYINEIEELKDKGYTLSEIGDIIRKNGYKGSDSTIRHYKTQLKKSNYEINKNTASSIATDTIERSRLLKLL